MEQRGDEVHIETTEASGGSKEGVVRWVLIIGTLLAIVLLSIIWMTGAAFQGDVEEERTVSGMVESRDDSDDTDSIVSDRQQFETIDEVEETGNAETGTEPVLEAETQN